MKLLTNEIRERLLRNGRVAAHYEEEGLRRTDFIPVLKLFTPDAGCTWILSELDPDDPDLAYGLCDLGMGFPELGPVRISEIENVRGRFGLRPERDTFFAPTHTLSVYARAAALSRAITEDESALRHAAETLLRGGAS